ncbi:hypothetical protein HY772_02710 [Candidatus Woesearchaeota archaeon]|nr:hypothetical protein [Candidatus Woesearchaeota archaeon]
MKDNRQGDRRRGIRDRLKNYLQQKEEKKKQVVVTVSFWPQPEGYWSSRLKYLNPSLPSVSDEEIVSSIERAIAEKLSEILHSFLDKEYPLETVHVHVSIKELSDPSSFLHSIITNQMTTKKFTFGAYDFERSQEGQISISIDAIASMFFYEPFQKYWARETDFMTSTLVHELLHHYDYFIIEYHEKMERKLLALYKANNRTKFLLYQNPSFVIRTFLIQARAEAVTTLGATLFNTMKGTSFRIVIDNPLLASTVKTMLRTISEGKRNFDFWEKREKLMNLRHQTGFMMALTIFFAYVDDLYIWREDILVFLRAKHAIQDMPKVNITRDKIREVSENIRKCKYRDFVTLYEESARKIGLREEEMILTSTELQYILKTVAKVMNERWQKEFNQSATYAKGEAFVKST